MRLIAFILLFTLSTSSLFAQGWSAKITSDSAYVGGWASIPGNGVGFSCAARSPLNGSVIDSQWFESSIAQPWWFLVRISETLIPASIQQRADVVLFVDQTGYRLPPVFHNELEGGWQVELPMRDPMFAAMAGASRLVLQVGAESAWELPVAQLGSALDELRQACAATWVTTGYAPPADFGAIASRPQPPPDGGAYLRQAAEGFAASNCSDFFVLGEGALRSANIDGDGIPDIVLDYNNITCNNDGRRPGVCGASLCSIDVFLSKTFARSGQPEQLLGMSSDLVLLTNGNHAVVTSGNLSMCQSTQGCAFYWYWNGSAFTELQQ